MSDDDVKDGFCDNYYDDHDDDYDNYDNYDNGKPAKVWVVPFNTIIQDGHCHTFSAVTWCLYQVTWC